MRTKTLLAAVIFGTWGIGLAHAAESGREKTERLLTVQGQGKAAALPDIATLSVEINREGSELDSLLSQVRKQMGEVLDVVKKQGIDEKDIRTDLFQVHPRMERDKRGNPQRTGFVVANRISVKVRDLKKTGKVLTAVLHAGATNVDGPNFEIDNPEAVERLALAAATKDAKTKAQAIADAAGVQLGDIITINPQTVNWPGPRRFTQMRAMAASSAMVAEEPMAAGEQTLTAFVTVSYAIR